LAAGDVDGVIGTGTAECETDVCEEIPGNGGGFHEYRVVDAIVAVYFVVRPG